MVSVSLIVVEKNDMLCSIEWDDPGSSGVDSHLSHFQNYEQERSQSKLRTRTRTDVFFRIKNDCQRDVTCLSVVTLVSKSVTLEFA